MASSNFALFRSLSTSLRSFSKRRMCRIVDFSDFTETTERTTVCYPSVGDAYGGNTWPGYTKCKSIFLHNIKNDHMSGSSFLLTQCVIPLSSPQWREVYAIMLNAISYCYSTESQFLLSAHNEDARRRSKGDISQETIPHVFCECIFVPLRRVSLAFEVALRKVVPSF